VGRQVLSVLNCVEVHGHYYLVDDMRVKCEEMGFERLLGLLGIVLFPVGIPLLFLVRTLHVCSALITWRWALPPLPASALAHGLVLFHVERVRVRTEAYLMVAIALTITALPAPDGWCVCVALARPYSTSCGATRCTMWRRTRKRDRWWTDASWRWRCTSQR
jgi:hypothetical protein